LTDRSISKTFLCHRCVVLYTVYVFYVRTAPVRSPTWRHDAHSATVVRGCCCGCRCRFRRPWSWRCMALLATCLFLSSSSQVASASIY